MTMTITINDIKVKAKILNSKTMLAQATVILFDVWKEKGWKVLKSNQIHPKFQEQIWIQSPCYSHFGKWQEMVFIENQKLYEAVQEKIYNAYCRAKNRERMKPPTEESKEEARQDKEVDPDEIPNFD